MWKPTRAEKKTILAFHGAGIRHFFIGYPVPGKDRPRKTRHKLRRTGMRTKRGFVR